VQHLYFRPSIFTQLLSNMKKHTLLLLVFVLLLTGFNVCPVHASTALSTTEMRTGWEQKLREKTSEQSEKTSLKTTKRMERMAKKLERIAHRHGAEVDFNDPVDKWLWFGLFGLGIGIVVAILGLGGVGGLIGFLGVVCLVVWILKKTDSI